MKPTPRDEASPERPPTEDGFLGVVLLTMLAEVLLVILWAAAVAPRPAF